MVKKRIAVLISGGGTNLQALIDAQKSGVIKHGEIVLVISSDREAYGLIRAEKAGIPSEAVSRKQSGSRENFEKNIKDILKEYRIDLIVLAGFMKILSGDFTAEYSGRIINIHPSLIPSFCGKGCYGLRVHEMALKYGVKVTGATVHFVNEIPDGGQIIMQKAVEIHEGDTPESLQRRVMEEAEWKILPQAVEKVCSRECKCAEGEAMKQYEIRSINRLIENNTYPGRGIITGKSESGKAVCAYFIMGRSSNSRNRIFAVEGESLYTEPFDSTKVEDPSLIIYAAIRRHENHLVITNGDQTDTIIEYLERGETFEAALGTRKFEPDYPNFTPRISAMISFGQGSDDFDYEMSILKRLDSEGRYCGRSFYNYEAVPGLGHFIHTYKCDGNPLPSFSGDPQRVEIPDSIDVFTETIWKSLNEENRISLYVKYTDPVTGESEQRLINRNA